MPITYDITTDGLYLEGIERGIERGIEQGEAQKTRRAITRALLKNILTIDQIADLLEVSTQQVLEVKKSMNL